MNRRRFLWSLALAAPAGAVAAGIIKSAGAKGIFKGYRPEKHLYGMGVDIEKCIGCGRCMVACKTENKVPKMDFFYRTWVERYIIKHDGGVVVKNIQTEDSPPQIEAAIERFILRSFFVPKLCNQCQHPPCVQVCPVEATFSTPEGVVLVDSQRCLGCRYCIQACPYGARYLHPETKTADKCTFCYHRIVKGMLPVCVEVCPTQARVFGNFKSLASPLTRFKRMNKIHVLKPELNTEPKVLYANLDGEVK